MIDLLLDNWAVIALSLLAFVDVIVSLTPSQKDDQFVGYIRIIIETISGRSKRKKG